MFNDLITKIKTKFSRKKTDQQQKAMKKVKEIMVPTHENWRTFTIAILLMSVLWHLQAVCGWLNGNTMVEHYGISSVLAEAIVRCPDLVFYATYISLALSILMLVIIGRMFVRFICDEVEASTALNVTLGCSIGTAWSFPVIHVVVDMIATGLNIRDTTGMDAFQLGIDIWPLIVITVVCIVLLMVNRRVERLMK